MIQTVGEWRRVSQPCQRHGCAQRTGECDRGGDWYSLTDQGCGSGPQHRRNREVNTHETQPIQSAGVRAPSSRQGQKPRGWNQTYERGQERSQPHPNGRQILEIEPTDQVTIVTVNQGQPGNSYDGGGPGHLDQHQLGEQ